MALDRKAALAKIQRDRRVESARKTQFGSLIATPFDMGTVAATNPLTDDLVLPEAANIGISFDDAVTAGDLIITTSTGRTLGTPDLSADELWRIGFFERSVEILVESGIAGTVTLHYLDDRRVPFAIATGVFT